MAAREPVSSELDCAGDEVGDIARDSDRAPGGDAFKACRAPDPPREIWLACENPLLPPVWRRAAAAATAAAAVVAAAAAAAAVAAAASSPGRARTATAAGATICVTTASALKAADVPVKAVGH